MTIYLKQNTASQEVPFGYFLDSTDGNSEETGLSIANTDIKIWKTGATTLANKNSGGATHISNGVYYAVLDATDTNTLGPMVIYVHVSGALAVKLECVVLAANIYDSLIGGGDVVDVSVTQVNGTAINNLVSGRVDASVGAMASGVVTSTAIASNAIGASQLASNCITAAKIATDAITSSQLATTAVTEIVGGVWNAARSSYTTAGSFGQGVASVQGNVTGSAASVTGAVGSVTSAVTVGTNNDKTGYSLSAAGIQAIWDALTSALTTVGSIGKILADNVNATISSRATPANVNTEVLDVLTVDTFAEPSSVPAATASLANKINFLAAMIRNKHITTASTDVVRNDGDSAAIATAAISDDGSTFTRSEYS